MSQSCCIRRPSCIATFLAAILVLSSATVAHATKYWKNGVVSGNWNVSNNWSAVSAAGGDNGGVPVASEVVNIVHTDGTARTVTYDVNAPSLGLLTIDLTNGSGATTDTLSIPITNNNNLSASGIFVGVTAGSGAAAGRGAINQANGSVVTNAGTDLLLAQGAGSTGTYTLSGGSLTAAQSEFIGWGGTATFNHSAGTNTISAGAVGAFDIGILAGSTGTYNLSGTGQLISNKSEYIGDSGTGYFNQTGGSNTIQGTSDLYLNYSASGRGTYTLSGGSLSVADNEYIGFASLTDNSFTQTGGTHSVGNALFIGCNNSGSGGGASRGTFSLSNSSTLIAGFVQVGGTFSSGNLTISNGGTASAGALALITGSVNVSGSGSALTINLLDADGTGKVQITDGSALHASSRAELYGFGTISVGGAGGSFTSPLVYDYPGWDGSLDINDQGLMDIGNLTIFYGTINLSGGTLRLATYFRDPVTSDLNYRAGTVQLTGNRTVSTDEVIADFFGATTAATTTAGKGLTIEGMLTVQTQLTLDGGTLTVASLVNNGTFNFDSGTLNINQAGANVNTPIVTGNPSTINVNATNVSLGSASSFTGFNHQGVLNVGANTVTLNSAGYARLGALTSISGGTINAPNGIYISGGGNLAGSGTVNARVTGDTGGVIEATGALAMGDAASPAGFNYAGELRTKQFAVTINSSAAAGLGNLTTPGVGASPGTLNATNGFVVDFDEAVTGYGTINSTNTLAKRATINGTVQGNSVGQPITLSGYIKGVGSFTNVNFTGTYSPGLSPIIVTSGNLAFASTNTLIMELGGTTPGSGHDQIQASGSLALGGTLDVQLVNGFTPSAGQSFNLFDWTTINGTFSTLTLPTLAGLAWNTSQLYTTGVLSVASVGVPGDYNNGTVDAADYILLRKGGPLANEVDNPGTVNAADYIAWRARFGNTSGAGAGATGSASAAIPEPASLTLLVSLSPLLPLFLRVVKNRI